MVTQVSLYACIDFLNKYNTALGTLTFESVSALGFGFLFFAIPFLAAAISCAVLSWGLSHFGKEVKTFRARMNYCYSCGESLKEATTTEVCPKCQSKLNLLDVVDIE